MTQTDKTLEFTARGKDRMSDPWVTATFTDFRDAEDWVAARAFVLPYESGAPIKATFVPRVDPS